MQLLHHNKIRVCRESVHLHIDIWVITLKIQGIPLSIMLWTSLVLKQSHVLLACKAQANVLLCQLQWWEGGRQAGISLHLHALKNPTSQRGKRAITALVHNT